MEEMRVDPWIDKVVEVEVEEEGEEEKVREKMCELVCSSMLSRNFPRCIKSSLIDGNIIGERTFSRMIPFSGWYRDGSLSYRGLFPPR